MTALPLVAALAWIAAIIADADPFEPAAALLIGVGLLVKSTVSVVGMTVAGSRWARRLALASVLAGLVIALIRPLDAYWVGAMTLTVIAGAGLFLPQVTRRIRKLPAAAGPPQSAVLVPIALLTVPFLLGVVSNDPVVWAVLVVGLSAPAIAFLYARVIPGGLLAVRVGWPLLAIALAPLLGMPGALLSVALGLTVLLIAWRPDVKTSFHPPRESGSTYPIPPELAPEEILDAANIDDRGRPR